MARIAGVDLPKNKTVEYGLTAIYGVGLFTANKVCAQLGIDKNKKCDDLTEEEQGKIRHLLEDEYSVEGQLRAEITLNIKRLQDMVATVASATARASRSAVSAPVPTPALVRAPRKLWLTRRSKEIPRG